MKSSTSIVITATVLLAALTTSTRLSSQSNPAGSSHKYHHYKLIDMGTFGGPQSYVTSPDLTVEADVNNHGVLAGWADTSTPDPFPNFCFNEDCFVAHAFQWKNGVRFDLGVLPGGGSSESSWISDSGLIAGVSENGEIDPLVTGFPELRAVLWKDGKIRDLGTLPEGGYESLAIAVNSSGLVVGLATNTTPDPDSMFGLGYQSRAFVWDKRNGMQDLGTLPGGTDAQALLVNERGQVLGWSYTSSVPSAACTSLVGLSLSTGTFLWDKAHGMVDIGGFGGTCTLASGLNNRGQVAGGSYFPGDQSSHAFLWDRSTGLKDLPTLGGHNAGAFAINDAGEAVGGSFLEGDLDFDAALWGKDGIADLGVVSGDCDSYAFGINASGQVVGSSFVCSSESSRGFLWEDGGPMVDLNTLILPNSTLYVPLGITINDRGEIAAPGLLPNGDQHAVLLIPCDENHPGVEGCDYSLVDESTVTRVSPAPIMQRPASAIQTNSIPLMLRRRLGLWSHMPALMRESQVQKFTSNTTSTSAPIVALSPTSLTFAAEVLGTESSARTVTLRNTGNASLTISGIAITGTNAGSFIQTHTCGSFLAAGASCSFRVTFKPSAVGTRRAVLSISDNAAGSPQKVPLSGTGVVSGPNATLSPSSLTFATQLVGTTSPGRSVTLSNYGTMTLNITSISASGDFTLAHTCGSSLAPLANCMISVTFKPTQLGTRSGTLSTTDNGGGSPQTVALGGTGVVSGPNATLSPTSLGFFCAPRVEVGCQCITQRTTTLSDFGTTMLSITDITSGGAFSQTNNCDASLGSGKSCNISVKWSPPSDIRSVGAVSVSDNAGGSPQSVSLEGFKLCTPP